MIERRACSRRTAWGSSWAGLAILLAILATPVAVAAAPPPPSSPQVLDGDGWQADDDFSVGWEIADADPPIAAVHYRVRDPQGLAESGPVRLGWPATHVWTSVRGSGIHTFEVWLEDATGALSPPAEVSLRFDSGRPGGVTPLQPSDWLSRAEFPYPLRLTHPSGPTPLSGIRGYAVSIDRMPSSSPCAAAYLCTDAETDLRGGSDGDTLFVAELPEGTSYAHVLAVSGSQVRSLAPGDATLKVDRTDPVTVLSGLPSGWTNRPVTLEATAKDRLSGMSSTAGGAPYTAIRVDDGAPAVAGGGSVSTTVMASGLHTISYYARDAAGNVNDGADSNGHPNDPPTKEFLGIDREPPSVVFAGAADPGDPELIEARVADPLSGPDPRRGEIAVRPAGSGERFVSLPTAVGGPILLAHWRSEDYPAGEYEFRATGYDAAGSAALSTRRANGESMILPNPLKARAILAAGFGANLGEGSARFIRQGSRVTFRGQLTIGSDASPAGRSLTVVERFDAGAAEPRRTSPVATGDDGRFSLRLEPGPSREVFAIFGGTNATTGTASRPLRLGVRPGVDLRASTPTATVGGLPVVFRGAVGAVPEELPAGGATVQLQFRAAGLPWTEFRSFRTNSSGRFRHPYRFSDDDSRGIRFRFRAFVPAQPGWPYEPGGSRPVVVRGR